MSTMRIILVHDDYDENHLAEVTEKMKKLGAPEIRAVWVEAYGSWVALEGCHRLRAAKDLGLTPIIISVDWSESVTLISMGLDYQDPLTIAELVDRNYNNVEIEFGNED